MARRHLDVRILPNNRTTREKIVVFHQSPTPNGQAVGHFKNGYKGLTATLDSYGFPLGRERTELLDRYKRDPHMEGLMQWAYGIAHDLSVRGLGELTPESNRTFFVELMDFLTSGVYDRGGPIGVWPDKELILLVPTTVSQQTALVPRKDLEVLAQSIGTEQLQQNGHSALLNAGYHFLSLKGIPTYFK